MKRQLPEKEKLNEIFEYNPTTGDVFKRPYIDKMGRYQTRYSKDPIRNTLMNHGGKSYYRTTMSGSTKEFLLHRIIFKMVYGLEPENIDHIDGNGLNNKLENLRASDPVSNHQNVRKSTRNTSGVVGVSLTQDKRRWRVRIKVGKKQLQLGEFVNFDEAVRVRREAEVEYGYHPNHGMDRPL